MGSKVLQGNVCDLRKRVLNFFPFLCIFHKDRGRRKRIFQPQISSCSKRHSFPGFDYVPKRELKDHLEFALIEKNRFSNVQSYLF